MVKKRMAWLVFGVLFFAFVGVAVAQRQSKAMESTTYWNDDFGYTFKYPKGWKVIREKKYQRAVCSVPEYRKNDPFCGKHPYVGLKNKNNGAELIINLRQAHTIIELEGGHWLSFDYALPSDKKIGPVTGTDEKSKCLDEETEKALNIIKDSFQLIKENT